MCRYGMSTYKEPFACFECRKSFKQTNYYELPDHVRPASIEQRVVKCPQCGNQMANMGHDFKRKRPVIGTLSFKSLFPVRHSRASDILGRQAFLVILPARTLDS